MEIRRLKNGEAKLHKAIASIAFNGRFDPDAETDPQYESPADWRWGYFQEGKLVSALTEIPYAMRFDGNTVAMSGIAAVVSLPEERRGGKVRSLFKAMLAEANEKGVAFSALAPFSHGFYRQFGYETCGQRASVTVVKDAFAPSKASGKFVQHYPGDTAGDLQEIHAAYIRDINFGIQRDSWADNLAWRQFAKNHPNKDGVFTYIWYDDSGVPRSYIHFTSVNGSDLPTLEVSEIIFKDAEALRSIFALIACMRFEKISWFGPSFLPYTDLFPENWQIEVKYTPKDMFRVVNLKKALGAMRAPEGKGEYVLEVSDTMLPANNGRFRVRFGGGETTLTPVETAPDITCAMPALSQLVTGFHSLDSAMFCRDDIAVHGNVDTLRRVFKQRRNHLTENF